ncbi:MAG: hypothetical protein IJW13_04600 [Clostridia bacterium]|nr:hypothetical protein [Clostridia bacterium]
MEFWSALTAIQKTYFVIGLAASVFLVLQIITLLFGFGDGGEVDVDFDGDGASDVTVDASDGFTLFSVRGIVAFFAIGGWVGYALAPVSTPLAIVCSLVAGSLALFAMALIMRAIMRLRSDGNISISRAIGKGADVYLTIPAKNEGFGKVTLTLEERFVELNAVQEGNSPIPTGSHVKVINVKGDMLVVEKE